MHLAEQPRIKIGEELFFKACGKIERAAFAEFVYSHGGHTGVEIAVIAGQLFGGAQMDQFGVIGQLVGIAVQLHAVFHARHQHVDFLRPDAQRVGQRAGEAAQEAKVALVDPAGAVGRHKGAAVFHEFLHTLGKIAAQHVGERRDDQIVPGEIAGLIQNVHIRAQRPERLVVIHHGIDILFIYIVEPLRIFQRPAVFPIVDQCHTRRSGRADDLVHLGKSFAHFGNLAEYAGVLMAAVIDHSAVELFGGAAALAELEVLHGIRAVGDGLHGLQEMHAGAMQAGIGTPVGRGGAALHQEEGLAVLKTARQVVLEGKELCGLYVVERAFPLGIAVPAGKIHHLRQAVVVDAGVDAHQVRGAGNIGCDALERFHLDLIPLDELLGGEALPIELLRMHGLLADGGGRFDLRPVGIGVAPERGPPGLIERVQRAVFFLQPGAEILLTGGAMAFAAELVADVPAAQRGMVFIALRQQGIDFLHLGAVYFARQAVIVTAAVELFDALFIDAQHLGVLLCHPGRTRAAGGGQQHVYAVFV